MAKILLAVLIISGLLGAGYWYWTETPQYSMRELADSVRHHNLENFRTYFDVDSVSNHAVEDLSSEEIRGLGGTSALRRFIGLTILGYLKPEATTALSNSICNYVKRDPLDPNASANPDSTAGNIADTQASPPPRREGFFARAVEGIVNKVVEAIKPPSLREVLHEMGITKENYRGLTSFEVKDSICHVGLRFQPPDQPEIVVQIELEKVEDHWHVIRFSNLADLARSVS